jgi:bifunctional enzyme CysN/CysC
MSVVLRLDEELDISRGDMICRPNNMPNLTQDIDAMVCWMTEQPLGSGRKLMIKHTTRMARVLVKDPRYAWTSTLCTAMKRQRNLG